MLIDPKENADNFKLLIKQEKKQKLLNAINGILKYTSLLNL